MTSYTLDVPMYVSNFTDGISRQTYNALSDAQKKAIDSVCTPEWSRLVYKHWYEDGIKREADVRKSDRKLTKIGPAEIKLWRDAAKPVQEAWAAAVKQGRLDPAAVLKELQDELRKEGALFEDLQAPDIPHARPPALSPAGASSLGIFHP